jgi:hypothetical protein
MLYNKNLIKFLLALFVLFALTVACSSKKDETETKEEVKKETTKDDDIKTDTRTETNTDTRSSAGSLYFVEEYRNGQEIGKSDLFTIPSGGGYLTVMIKLDKPIGVGKVDLRISRKAGGSEKIIDTLPFDVQPDWDYIHFDEVTFKQDGLHKVTLLKTDGTPLATGEVEIKYR